MAIDFHCEHCGKLVKAPEAGGGRSGKCPHCQGVNYIPTADADAGELPLAPLDTGYERHRRQAAAEDAALQRRLLADRASPRETGGMKGVRRPDLSPTSSPPTMSRKQLTSSIVSFITAMSKGDLDKADKLVGQMSGNRAQAAGILDAMMTEDLTGYGLLPLPRPVLVGFLKQLRMKL